MIDETNLNVIYQLTDDTFCTFLCSTIQIT